MITATTATIVTMALVDGHGSEPEGVGVGMIRAPGAPGEHLSEAGKGCERAVWACLVETTGKLSRDQEASRTDEAGPDTICVSHPQGVVQLLDVVGRILKRRDPYGVCVMVLRRTCGRWPQLITTFWVLIRDRWEAFPRLPPFNLQAHVFPISLSNETQQVDGVHHLYGVWRVRVVISRVEPPPSKRGYFRRNAGWSRFIIGRSLEVSTNAARTSGANPSATRILYRRVQRLQSIGQPVTHRGTAYPRPIAIEVDLSAAALSIFLAVTGQPLPLDLYAHGPLAGCNRNAVKQRITQSMNMGRPARRWAGKTSAAVRKVLISSISTAALTAYPGLAEPVSAVPPDVRDRAPFDRGGWALGQWITSLEAEIMAAALDRLMEQGVVALPLHDAVLVPEGDVQAAQEALEEAFESLLCVRPRVKVKGVVSLTLEGPPEGSRKGLVKA